MDITAIQSLSNLTPAATAAPAGARVPGASGASVDLAHAAAARKAEDFEALVLSQMLAPMFDTAKSPSLFGGDGPEQDTFRSMLNDEYAKLLAARGGIGIADSVKAALLQQQSNNNIIQETNP